METSLVGRTQVANRVGAPAARFETTIFKSTGRTSSGSAVLMQSFPIFINQLPRDITIEYCGFDINGWNRHDFGAMMVRIYGDYDGSLPAPDQWSPARNIVFHDNRFFDSVYDADPTAATEDCDISQDACATRQRIAIMVKQVDGVWIYDNDISGGGRIFAGGPGRYMYIRNNTLDFVNDNAISIVEHLRDTCAEVPCLTEHVEIGSNVINNAISAGIFFGLDGEADSPEIAIDDILISNNVISGYCFRPIHGMLPAGGASRVTVDRNQVFASRPRPIAVTTAGITLARSGQIAPVQPSSELRITRNSVTSESPFGWLYNGIHLVGPLEDVTATSNTVTCVDCSEDCAARMEAGIEIAGGQVTDLDLSMNTLTDACLAIRALADLHLASFANNTLLNSYWPVVSDPIGQLYFSGSLVDAAVYDNVIEDGAGWGIACRHSGYSFSGPTNDLDADNTLTGNFAGSVTPACF